MTLPTKKIYTKADLRHFARLVERASSKNGNERVIARIDMSVFTKRMGKEVCDAMWAELKKTPVLKDHP